MTSIAVLDDYQGVALEYGDWQCLGPDVRIVPFRQHISDPVQLVRALQAFDVVVAMRERTRLPRAVIEQLVNLKLLVTTGPFNAAIDAAALHEHGIVYCGTGGTATPHIGYVTDACYRIFYRESVEDIQAWLDGRPIRLVSS